MSNNYSLKEKNIHNPKKLDQIHKFLDFQNLLWDAYWAFIKPVKSNLTQTLLDNV